MANVLISADSTCDISGELLENTKALLIPLHIILDDKSYDDGVDIRPDDIYENFAKTGALPKTSAINTQEYIDIFTPYIEKGYEIVHINIGSAISSSYHNCVEASKMIEGLYPVNSCNLSSGSGHLVVEAASLAAQGYTAKEISDELKKLVPKCHASFIIDKLDYLRAGGRCSTLAMLGANLLQLKPCIEVNNQDGSMTVGKKYRGKLEKVLISYVHDQLDKYNNNIRDSRIFITHAGIGQKYVDIVKAEIEKLNFFRNIYIERASCTISSHCGPGTLGILFMTK